MSVVATRQNSSNGKLKSPRVQVVLPEDLCKRLTLLAEQQSRTVSNMAKVLIQEGVNRLEEAKDPNNQEISKRPITENFRSSLEAQQSRRLRGAPRRIKLKKL